MLLNTGNFPDLQFSGVVCGGLLRQVETMEATHTRSNEEITDKRIGVPREYQPGCGGGVGRIATAADPVNAAFPDGMKALKGVGIMEAGTKKIG